jgi:hypothetical protein
MKAFPPYELLEQHGVVDATRKTRRLERLYDMTRERSWDGKALLKELIEKHGQPGHGLDPEVKGALRRVLTVLTWGELAAWNISADLALEIDDVDAKMAATAQVFDEARHFTVLSDYVRALGPSEPIGALPRQLLRKVLAAPTLATKLVGMQLLFETNAVVIFRRLAELELCPVLSELMPYFERDESRHVGLGVMYVPRLIERMSPAEARRTARFQFECIMLLMASGFTFRPDFELLGLDQRLMTERITRMQDDIVRQMTEHHGKGVLRAVLSPRSGIGPRIVDFIHPEGGLESAAPWHQWIHKRIQGTLTSVDRALA